MKRFLAGDVGGTKTLLQLSGEDGKPLLQKSYPSAAYPGLGEMLDEFLGVAGKAGIASACMALAGPVSGRRVKLTNLPWEVDADNLAERFGIPAVSFINDFEAVGHGVSVLPPEDLLTLQAGKQQEQGRRVVVGAGTGLGVAWLTPAHGRYVVHPSEGGHMDFAPADAIQFELLQYLQQRHGHVSCERIVSGPGLVAIFEFLRDSGRGSPSAHLLAAMDEGDAAAALGRFAQEHDEPVAQMALDLFVSIYGAFAGNLALLALPFGGVYVAGGIAPKIASVMRRGGFMQAFRDKGRYSVMLGDLPVHIVNNPQVGLLGAALQAGRITKPM